MPACAVTNADGEGDAGEEQQLEGIAALIRISRLQRVDNTGNAK
jgi:tellurite resistance protein